MYKRNLREINELRSLGKSIRVVGLTGGIASGKTVATNALAAAGFHVIDADEISRALFGKNTGGEKELLSLFPAAADDNGKLDRAELRRIISASDGARKKLNGATHPKIVSEIKRMLAEDKNRKTVLSAPLLFESGLSSLCDCVVCVTCPTRVKLERLQKRDGMTEHDAKRLIAAQIPDTYRATLADFCVPSDRDKEKFEAETVDLFRTLFGMKKP